MTGCDDDFHQNDDDLPSGQQTDAGTLGLTGWRVYALGFRPQDADDSHNGVFLYHRGISEYFSDPRRDGHLLDDELELWEEDPVEFM